MAEQLNLSEQNKLPSNWAEVDLERLGTWLGGGTPSKQDQSYWNNGTIPWASPKDIKTLCLNSTIDYITKKALIHSATNLVSAGSVLMVTRSGILRHTFPIAVCQQDMAINQDLKALTLYEGIDPEFIAYYLNFKNYDVLRKCAKDGTTVQSIDFAKLKRFSISLAPSHEQSRIVSKIEELFTELDKGEEALRRVQKLIERYRQSVLKAAITGELTREWREKNQHNLETGKELLARILKARREAWEKTELDKMQAKGKKSRDDKWKKNYKEPKGPDTSVLPELPEGWVWARLEQLTTLITSGSRGWAKHYSDNGSIFIRAQDINTDKLILDNIAHVRLPQHAEGIRTEVHKHDILITITGANITKTAIVNNELNDAYVSQHVGLVRLALDSIAPYLYFYIVCPSHGRKLLEGYAYGAGKPGLSLINLRDLPIVLPPMREQSKVVDKVEQILTTIKTGFDYTQEIFSATILTRQSILKAAFSGKLVPQDPNDEPASELLKRIAAEREARQATKPKRRGAPSRKAKAKSKPRGEASQQNLPLDQGQAIKAARKKAGLTQAALAKATGINQVYISQIENNKREMTEQHKSIFKSVLGIAF